MTSERWALWRPGICCNADSGVSPIRREFGLYIIEIAHMLDIRIPEQISVVGVDDDEQLCNLTYPTLSSVITPGEDLGFEAAHLLDRMMSGEAPPAEPILLPPLGVTIRASSDIIAYEDPRFAMALRFIHANFHRQINVTDVLRHAPMARRTLADKMRAAVGRTPLQEIQRLRLDRAKELIEETGLPMREIAMRAGYGGHNRMLAAFHKYLRLSPDEYRRAARDAGSRLFDRVRHRYM